MNTRPTLLLAALLAITLPAQADTWHLANQAGGRIVLSERACADPAAPELREAYAYSQDGSRTAGCWALFDGLVQIAWGAGQRSVFAPDAFTHQPGTPATPKPASSSRRL